MLNLTRYKRNLGIDGLDENAQKKLITSKVIIMGAGALGCGVISNLASLGIGQIKIIDDGIVEEENFNRQFLHKYKNLNRAKVISIKDWILEYNPNIKVEIEKVRLNEKNYLDLIKDYNIIVDCFDDIKSKYLLNDIAIKHERILVHGNIRGFCGQVTTINPPKTGCLGCVEQKPYIFPKEEFTKLSTTSTFISSLQAQEVLKVITGYGEPLYNKLLMYNGSANSFKIINYSKNIVCDCCNKD